MVYLLVAVDFIRKYFTVAMTSKEVHVARGGQVRIHVTRTPAVKSAGHVTKTVTHASKSTTAGSCNVVKRGTSQHVGAGVERSAHIAAAATGWICCCFCWRRMISFFLCYFYFIFFVPSVLVVQLIRDSVVDVFLS